MRHDLIQRAGLTEAILQISKKNPKFKEILETMEIIYNGKQVLYGDYLETHGSDPTNLAIAEHYCDIKRKYVRADSAVKKILSGENIDIDELTDTYLDLAVYGAIGVMLIDHLKERNDRTRKNK